MNIGIDCRFWGAKHTGLGRYTENLVLNLLKIDKKNTYVLFLRKKDIDNFQFPISNFQNFKLVRAEFPHYSFREQLLMGGLIEKSGVELMHFPHFNIPILNSGKFVVTIHDLIKSQFLGLSATTRNPLFYYFKYLNYRWVIKKAIKGALKIITPSNFIKKEILENYKIESSRVKVIYEGVDEVFRKSLKVSPSQLQKIHKDYKIKKPFLLYVGNLYWHKNLIQLIKVLNLINQTERLHLVVASKKDKFYQSLRKEVMKRKLESFVNFIGFVPDEDLRGLYQEALAFVNPSLMEGFGLPGLEALNCSCLVLSSNRGALPEVYQEAAIYFDPEDSKDLEAKIRMAIALNREERKKEIEKGLELSGEYSWEKCARETLRVYQEVLRNA